MAGAYALRDRAWQTIPYLAQWLFARLHTADSGRIADLQALTQGTHELGAELDRAIVETTGKSGAGVEQNLDMNALQPGPYVVKVTALREAQVLATRRVRFVRPEYPQWWMPRK